MGSYSQYPRLPTYSPTITSSAPVVPTGDYSAPSYPMAPRVARAPVVGSIAPLTSPYLNAGSSNSAAATSAPMAGMSYQQQLGMANRGQIARGPSPGFVAMQAGKMARDPASFAPAPVTGTESDFFARAPQINPANLPQFGETGRDVQNYTDSRQLRQQEADTTSAATMNASLYPYQKLQTAEDIAAGHDQARTAGIDSTNDTRRDIATDTNTTRANIAGANAASREKVAGDAVASKEKIAAGANTSKEKVAADRNSTMKEIAQLKDEDAAHFGLRPGTEVAYYNALSKNVTHDPASVTDANPNGQRYWTHDEKMQAIQKFRQEHQPGQTTEAQPNTFAGGNGAQPITAQNAGGQPPPAAAAPPAQQPGDQTFQGFIYRKGNDGQYHKVGRAQQ